MHSTGAERRTTCFAAILSALLVALTGLSQAQALKKEEAAQALADYYVAMSVPEPFTVLTGDALKTHQQKLRARILADASLDPLPERIPLDIHRSEPIDHPWCTIEKIEYQLWPGVYSEALLVVPKEFKETPAPAALCPHGHWNHGYAYPDVQKRLITLAKMGYVVLSPRQNHHENLPLGVSHQTVMIWTNMRGLDLLQSLPEVDPERIGAAGASGGGLQTQMIAALDDRVKAATIVGLTCEYREIMFAHGAHCGCNHFPNVMTYTDLPEISALAFPRAVQYLIMNDWTRHFAHNNFPAIQELYRLNDIPARTTCTYWPTAHIYDRQKRERTYWWMERWLRKDGSYHTAIPSEPDEVVTVFPPQMLEAWPVKNPNNKGLEKISQVFHEKYHYSARPAPSPTDFMAFQRKMRQALPQLLGLANGLAPEHQEVRVLDTQRKNRVSVARVLFPSEGNLSLPALVLAPQESTGPLPVTICLSKQGMPSDDELGPWLERAANGEFLIMPEIRFSGVFDLEELAGVIGPEMVKYDIANNMPPYEKPEDQHKFLLWAWERNSVVWGHSLIGMAVTDLQNILKNVETDPRANTDSIKIEARGAGHLAMAAAFAAILDPRIQAIDIDLMGSRYDQYSYWYEAPKELPVIPFVLRYGDVPQWLAVLADRTVSVSNLEATEQETRWVKSFFAAAANAKGLSLK